MAIFTAIGGAIAGALFTSASAIALGTSIIGGALAFGAQYLLNSYLGRQSNQGSTYAAVQGQREYGARVPVWALYGTGKVMGHHIYYAKWGAGNKFNADVFVLSNGWCDGLEPYVYFYGEKHTLFERPIIGNEVAHYGVNGFDNLISIRFYDGRPGQGPDTKLVADTAGLGQTWKNTSVCAGMAYVVVEREWSEEKFEKGQPEFEFIMRGLRLYDPRRDGSIVGGAGAHRQDNPATWEFSRNPAVQRLNYQLGLRGHRSGRILIGEGKTLGQLDLNSYFAAMNVADTPRSGKPTYQSSLIVTSDDDHTEVLKEFDDAMAGYGMNRRGLSGVIPGAPQIATLNIGPDDIDMGRSSQMRRRKSAFDLYNQMSGQFISPDANWNAQSLTPLYVNADIAADGRARQIAYDFLQVTDPDIAQYLLQIRYRQNRKGGSATLPVSRRVGFNVMEGDWVTYDGVTWLVTGWQMDSNLEFTLTLAETGADVYSSAGIEPGPIVVPSPPPINPSMLSNVLNFAVEVGMIEGSDGFQVPVLRFTWLPPSDPTITQVRFEYFAGANPIGAAIFTDACDFPERGEYITTKNVASGLYYTARNTITTRPDRFKTWSQWLTTSTTTGPLTVYLDGMIEEIVEQVSDIAEFGTTGARALLESHHDLAADDADATAAGYTDRRVTKNEIAIQIGNTRAYVSEQIVLAVGPESAIASRLNTIEVEMDEGFSSVNQLVQTEVSRIDGELTATSDWLTDLASEVAGIESRFTMRAQTVASPGGGITRWVVQVQAGAPGNYISSALFLEADSNGIGSAGFITDRFFLVNPADTGLKINPFVFEGGVAYMQNARIGDLIFNKLRSADGKMVISGMGGTYLDIYV